MSGNDFFQFNNKNISFNDFKNALIKGDMTEKEIQKLFNVFDSDKDGFLNVSNKANKNEVQALFNSIKTKEISNKGLTLEKSTTKMNKGENTNLKPLDALSDEETKNLSINLISTNVKNAKKIFNNQVDNQGYVNDFVNGFKETFDTEFASSRVNRYLLNEENKVKLLTLANQGNLSKKEYYESKINFIINILLPSLNGKNGINANNEKQDLKHNAELIKNELENLTPLEIENFISSIVMLSEEEYLEKAPVVTKNLIKQAKNKLVNKKIEKNEEITVSGSIKNMQESKEIYEKMSFEDTFLAEYGIEYNPKNIKDFQEKDTNFKKISKYFERNEFVKNLLNNNASIATQENKAYENKDIKITNQSLLMDNISKVFKELYTNNPKDAQNLIDSILGKNSGVSVLTDNTGKIKDIRFEGINRVSVTTNKDGKLDVKISDNTDKNNNFIKKKVNFNDLNILSKGIQQHFEKEYQNELNGHSLEYYAKDLDKAFKKAYGSKNAEEISKAFVQSQQEGVQYAKIAGSTLLILAQANLSGYPLVAFATMLGAMGSGVGISSLEAYSKENGPTKEDLENIKNEIKTTVPLTLAGIASGTASASLFRELVQKNCNKTLAWLSEVGTDAGVSLLADKAITGEIDVSGEGFAQLLNILVGLVHSKGNLNKYMNEHAGNIKNNSESGNNNIPKENIEEKIKINSNDTKVVTKKQNYEAPVVKEQKITTKENFASDSSKPNNKVEINDFEQKLRDMKFTQDGIKVPRFNNYEIKMLMETDNIDKDVILKLLGMTVIKDGQEVPRFDDAFEVIKIAQTIKIDKDLTFKLLDMKTIKNGVEVPRFNGHEIKDIVNASKIDKDLTSKLLNMKVIKNGQEVARFNGYEIKDIVNASKIDKDFILQLTGLKKPKDEKFVLNLHNSEIILITNAITRNNNIVKYFKNLSFDQFNYFCRNNILTDILKFGKANSFGSLDLYKNVKLETIQKIPKDLLHNLYAKDHLYVTDEHVAKTLDFFETPKFGELETTIKNKFPQIDNNELDIKLKTYLISKPVGKPDDFIKYIQNCDFDNLTQIAPRMKSFNAEQLLEFLNYHNQKGTELTPENLTYSGSLTHDMEKELVFSDRLRDTLSRFPNTNRNIGHLPIEWMKDIPKENQKDFYNKLDKTLSDFVKSDHVNNDIKEVEKNLSLLFEKKATVKRVGSGSYGEGYSITIEGQKPFFFKAFKNIPDEFLYEVKSIHGKTIEPQNALYAKNKANNFAGFYMGKVADNIDKDGYMILEFLSDNSNTPVKNSVNINKIYSEDVSSEHNIINGKIIDYGAMSLKNQTLLNDPAIARYTRIISDNLILFNPNKHGNIENSKESFVNTYSFNKKRFEIVKNMAMESNEPEKVIQAIEILKNQKEFVIAPNSLKALDEIELMCKEKTFETDGKIDNNKKTYKTPVAKEFSKELTDILNENSTNIFGQKNKRFTVNDIDIITELFITDPELTKTLVNEKQICMGHKIPRFNAKEIKELVNISKNNKDFILELVNMKTYNSKNEEIPRFNARRIIELAKLYEKDKDFVNYLIHLQEPLNKNEKISTWRFDLDDIKSIMELDQNHQDFIKTLIEEKYVNYINKIVSRFDALDIVDLTECYNINKKLTLTLINSKKTTINNKIRPSLNTDNIVKLVKLAKTDPDFMDFIINNDGLNRFDYNEIKSLFNLIDVDKDILMKCIEYKQLNTNSNKYRFDFFDIDFIENFVNLYKDHKDLILQLLDKKIKLSPNVVAYQLNAKNIENCIKLIKQNKNVILDIINDTNQPFNNSDISDIIKALKIDNMNVVENCYNATVKHPDGTIQKRFNKNNFISIIEKLTSSNNINITNDFISAKKSNGDYKFNKFDLHYLFGFLDNPVYNKSIVKYIDEIKKEQDIFINSNETIKELINKIKISSSNNEEIVTNFKNILFEGYKNNNIHQNINSICNGIITLKSSLLKKYISFMENHSDLSYIDKEFADILNNTDSKVIDLIYNNSPEILFSSKNVLKNIIDIPFEVLNQICQNNEFMILADSVYMSHCGGSDLYKNVKLETIQKIPKDILHNLYAKDHLYVTDEHVAKTLDFFETPKFDELETTIKNKFSQIDNNELDIKLKTYLISKPFGNPDDFIKYIQNCDFDNLTQVAPRMKSFNAEQLLEFLNYHNQKGTELTPENLTYSGSLTHDMEKELVLSDRLRDTLSRFPNTNRNVGHLPIEWMKDIPKKNQKDFYNKLDKTLTDFVKSEKTNENVSSFEQALSLIFNNNVTVKNVGSGCFGIGYSITVEGEKPFFFKAFKNMPDEILYDIKSIHGKTIEPQNALYAKNRTNNFAKFYMGKVADTIDKDGYMILEFLSDKSNNSVKNSVNINNINSEDAYPGHNIINGKIIDYGAMSLGNETLLKDSAIAHYTRIISDNLILIKSNNLKNNNNTQPVINTYSFNEQRLEIVKNMVMESNEPEKIIQAIEILKNQKEFVITPNSLKALDEIELMCKKKH